MFGAFTAVSWPKLDRTKTITVADTSRTSFLFSLVSEYAVPFRLSLVDSARAIQLTENGEVKFGASSVAAGGKQLWSNFGLFYQSKTARQAESCYSNECMAESAYGVAESQWRGRVKPAGFKCDENTLAGKKDYACAEIEVYAV